ncbi:hypothetical protein [Streptomyces sp. CAU 1734]|uniref:hypothetical protein n=1 Tax=Streptomyces sp. CAU 1734 TaxID=3140360 RepID=UPI00325FE523
MRPRSIRPLRTGLPALAVLLLAAGCGTAGEIKSAGPAETATGPVRIWPDLPPVTDPPHGYGEATTARVPRIRVPSDGVRGLDPVKVLLAEAEPGTGDIHGLFGETAKGIRECGRKPGTCPVLTPYYGDLTGDGREDLITGVTMPRQQTAVRVYTPDEYGRLTRVMATSDQLVSVELASRDLVLRSVSAGIPGYEYRTAWSWDERHRAMLPKRDEIIRVVPRSAADRRSGLSSKARESAAAGASGTPGAGASAGGTP